MNIQALVNKSIDSHYQTFDYSYISQKEQFNTILPRIDVRQPTNNQRRTFKKVKVSLAPRSSMNIWFPVDETYFKKRNI